MLKKAYWGRFGYSCPTVIDVEFIDKTNMKVTLDNGYSFNVSPDKSNFKLDWVKIFVNDRDADKMFIKLEYQS